MAILSIIAGMTSCGNDWLDQTPSDGIDASGAVTTVSDLETVRNGVYASLKGIRDFVDYYGRNMFIYGDMRGEDVQYNWVDGSGRGNFYYYMTYSTADNFSGGNTPWQSAFIVTERANRVIEAAESGTLGDDEAIAQYEAEAKTLRAMALFDLTRIYGKPYTMDKGASLGAPIMLKPVENAYANKPKRNTVAECYTQIEKDLDDAVKSGALPTSNKGDASVYINLWAAKALQVRVYMTKGEWGKALATARDIISNSPYVLWTPEQYAEAWAKTSNTHNNEIIFELSINDNKDWTDREGIAYCMSDAHGDVPGYGDIMVTKAFAEAMEADPADARNNVLLKPGGDPDTYAGKFETDGNDFVKHGVFINKMPAHNGDVRYANVPMLRLSEVYLSAAEAAFQTGDKAAAAQLLNKLITNRTTDATKVVTAEDITLDRIYMERRKELVGEGQRYFDVIRRGETVVRYTNDNNRGWHDVLTEEARTFNRDSKKALPLIPVAEINANPNIQQNPLY